MQVKEMLKSARWKISSNFCEVMWHRVPWEMGQAIESRIRRELHYDLLAIKGQGIHGLLYASGRTTVFPMQRLKNTNK